MPDLPPAGRSTRLCQQLIYLNERLARFCGATCAAMIPFMVLITVVIVVMRRGFNLGSIALQETVVYMHAWVFLMAMAYTFKADSQVRVDILYRKFSPTQKAWINAIGGLVLLLPLCVVLLITTSQYALRSWQVGEVSAEAAGLPLVYLLKSIMPLAALLLLLQCLGDVASNTLRLIGRPVAAPQA